MEMGYKALKEAGKGGSSRAHRSASVGPNHLSRGEVIKATVPGDSRQTNKNIMNLTNKRLSIRDNPNVTGMHYRKGGDITRQNFLNAPPMDYVNQQSIGPSYPDPGTAAVAAAKERQIYLNSIGKNKNTSTIPSIAGGNPYKWR